MSEEEIGSEVTCSAGDGCGSQVPSCLSLHNGAS